MEITTETAKFALATQLLTTAKLPLPTTILKMGLVEKNERWSLGWMSGLRGIIPSEANVVIHQHEADEHDPAIGVRGYTPLRNDLEAMGFQVVGVKGACRGWSAKDYNTLTEAETFIEYMLEHGIDEAAVMTIDLHMLRTMITLITAGAAAHHLRIWALPVPVPNLNEEQRLAGTKVHENGLAVMADELPKFWGEHPYQNFVDAGCDIDQVLKYCFWRSQFAG